MYYEIAMEGLLGLPIYNDMVIKVEKPDVKWPGFPHTISAISSIGLFCFYYRRSFLCPSYEQYHHTGRPRGWPGLPGLAGRSPRRLSGPRQGRQFTCPTHSRMTEWINEWILTSSMEKMVFPVLASHLFSFQVYWRLQLLLEYFVWKHSITSKSWWIIILFPCIWNRWEIGVVGWCVGLWRDRRVGISGKTQKLLLYYYIDEYWLFVFTNIYFPAINHCIIP